MASDQTQVPQPAKAAQLGVGGCREQRDLGAGVDCKAEGLRFWPNGAVYLSGRGWGWGFGP